MKFVTYLVMSLLGWLVTAWEFMLAVGVAHAHWWPALPLLGYRTALVIAFLLFSMLTGGTFTTVAYARARR